MIRAHVLICGGTGCTSSGSASIQKAFAENQPDAAAASTFAGKISILGPSGLHSLNNLLKYSIFLVFKCFYWTFYG